MSDELQFSDEYMAMLEVAMEHALDSVSEGGPLIPFVMYEHNGMRSMQRFVAGETDDNRFDLEASVKQARAFIRGLRNKADVAAIALDGRLEVDGEMVDAILVQVYQSGMPAAYHFAQTYRPAEDPEGFAVVGEGAVVSEDAPLW